MEILKGLTMIQFLSKLFIKDYHDYTKPSVRQSYGILASIVGIFFNILLFTGKYIAGVISGSIAIIADAFNNLSDAGSSVITLIGFKLSGKKPDSSHPFGHGRMEYISGLTVSFIILLMGLELFKTSFSKILHPQSIETDFLSIGILIVSIMIKLYMAFYNHAISNNISSCSMHATALDSLSDSIATSVVLISVVVFKVFNLNMDGYSGLVVALFILYTGFNAAKDTINPLLGNSPDPELISDIQQIVMAHEEILGIHDLVVHDYGPGRLMISLHGEVDGKQDVFCLHDAIDCIETELNSKLNCEAVIHMDPIVIDDQEVITLRQELNQIIKKLEPTLTLHDFRMVKGTTHTNLIFDIVVPYHIKMSEGDIRENIQKAVSEKHEHFFTVIKIDKPYTT